MRTCTKHYIGGLWVDSDGGTLSDVINPATEQVCTHVIHGTAADVDSAVAAARAAFADWSATSMDERKTILSQIVEVYQRRIPDIAYAVSEEMGAPISLALSRQAPAGLMHFKATLDAIDALQLENRIGDIRIVHEPIGVVAMITPWNWPLNQICAKVAPALAAGNTMILKPSEQAPSCAVILAEILHEAGIPAGVFNLVMGRGTSVGARMCAHPEVDMVSFTGSTRAGVAIAQAAAPTVKRVHQELGGKAPNLVLPGADLGTVLPPTIAGILSNSGQSCIAPTRILVHEDQLNAVIAIVKDLFDNTLVGNPASEGNHIGPVVNQAQYDKIQSLIQSGIDEGATLVAGGLGRPDGYSAGYYVRPTLFSGVRPEMRIAQEETFGPVATITAYYDEAEAIALANDTIYGLSATISGDPSEALKVASKLRAGLVTINSWAPAPEAPFGGYKQSGNGRENGKYGLLEFTEVKSIIGAPH